MSAGSTRPPTHEDRRVEVLGDAAAKVRVVEARVVARIEATVAGRVAHRVDRPADVVRGQDEELSPFAPPPVLGDLAHDRVASVVPPRVPLGRRLWRGVPGQRPVPVVPVVELVERGWEPGEFVVLGVPATAQATRRTLDAPVADRDDADVNLEIAEGCAQSARSMRMRPHRQTS